MRIEGAAKLTLSKPSPAGGRGAVGFLFWLEAYAAIPEKEYLYLQPMRPWIALLLSSRNITF